MMLIFQKRNIPNCLLHLEKSRATILEQRLFQKTLPSVGATFLEELLSHNIAFQSSSSF